MAEQKKRGPQKAAFHGKARLFIGDRLRRWRLEANLSTSELEHRAHMGASTLGSYENGSTIPNVLFAERICRALGHTMNELVEGLADADDE